MGKPIPTSSEVAKKWKDRASGAQSEYVAKVKVSTWKTEAVAGEDNFKTAMANVVSKELRKKGIEKRSDSDWQNGVEKKADRYGTGVTGAETKFDSGIAPVLTDIKSALSTLDKRGPRGSASNYTRSSKLGTALHDAKLKRKGAA